MRSVFFMLTLALFVGSCYQYLAAETYPIVATGQVQTFDNEKVITAPKKGEDFYGQDAQFIVNEMSYTDNGDGTITDNVTGLMWQKGFKVMSYADAVKEVKALNKKDKYKNWRIPTIKELYSIMNFNGEDVSVEMNRDNGNVKYTPFIDEDYFDFEYGSNGERIIDTQLLSSTKYTSTTMGGAETLFGLNVADGRIKGYPIMMGREGKTYTVRFVRGNDQYGINKFIDNKDNTITDEATGLMWSKDDSQRPMTWQEAFAYVQNLNDEKYLGYSDWRLPNAKELHSIVDYSRSPKKTGSAAIDPIFNVTKITVEDGSKNYPEFWSSTTHKSMGRITGSAAVYISFGEAMGFMQQRRQQPSSQSQGGMGQGGGQRPSGSSMGQGGQRPSGGMGQGGGERPSSGGMGQSQGGSNAQYTLMDVHGAGAQRSDPKVGDPKDYPRGKGPQGDTIRIYNYVRVVRTK